jgi:hypothetical protein
MATHPYAHAPAYRRWSQAVARVDGMAVDPVVRPKFHITAEDRVVTAGSCFAQHIARHLPDFGCQHFVTEPVHELLDAEQAQAWNYGVYSARTGNIYTARQLLQLLRRARGAFVPAEDIWAAGAAFHDPFRPAVQPGGFASRREYAHDRARHFAAVRQAFSGMDVFIFTLGLIEAWESTTDDAVFPICPGTVAGIFDPALHRLRIMSVEEVVADLRDFLLEARAYNPHFRTILTVSPVPLAATAADRHVLEATVHAKSVLRVAAEIVASDPAVAYFPSYEIVTGAHARGAYFADDLRAVTEDGVAHVMRLFAGHMVVGGTAPLPTPPQSGHFERQRQAVALLCEEQALDPG